MGSASMEIGLDLKVFAARMVSGFLKEVRAEESGDGKVAKLEESVRSLEEEKRKVEAFKRELPLSMNLLTVVIEALKKDLDQWRGQRFARVFGELLPIKSELGDPALVEEKNWMRSAHLWRDGNGGSNSEEAKNEEKMAEKRYGGFDCLRRKENLESKSLNGGGAFVPFKALSGLPEISKERAPANEPSTLLLPAPPHSNATLSLSASSCSKGVGSGAPESAPTTTSDYLSRPIQQQEPRKMRRCWSPELHRHFLSALEQLGGAQVATPKQIRELMKVEGLTNDEVKSHLQKHRLHSRGKPKSSDAMKQPLPISRVAVSSEEQRSTSSQQSGTQSGSPQKSSSASLEGDQKAIARNVVNVRFRI